MSGAGRKSGYRKGVTDSFLNDYPLPEEGISQIVKVKGVRGSNQIEIIDANGQESLALLPNKFRKLIYLFTSWWDDGNNKLLKAIFISIACHLIFAIFWLLFKALNYII